MYCRDPGAQAEDEAYTVEAPLSAGWTAEIAAAEHTIDLAIVTGHDAHARGLLEHGHCSVLVLRR